MAAISGQTKLKRRLFRRGQAGQSLIILAIGFVALLGFVGIVTDVSLLFVRYSTLRRAVDAAAVAAAGQMRRVPAATAGEEQAASVANINLAARQFIEVYGLNPSQVVVETCYTQKLPMIAVVSGGVTSWRPADRNGVLLYTYASGDPHAPKTGPNPAANNEDRLSYEDLCKDNEVKLVRVSAQIESPTVFLRLLGFPTILLTESSISQTAVLDVVLILDVSESMSFATTYDDWETQGYYYRYIPPFVPEQGIAEQRHAYPNWDYWNSHSLTDIMNVRYQVPTDPADAGLIPFTDTTGAYAGQLIYGVDAVDNTSRIPVSAWLMESGVSQTGPTIRYWPPDVAYPPADGIMNEPHLGCRVRVSPISVTETGASIPPWLMEEYTARFGSTWVNERFNGRSFFSGMVPMYRSYACCNDPNGDFVFDDLVCQPFQQVRNATDQFLSNLDFIRGDRVAFVTFDVTAHVIDPDGVGEQRPMIEIEDSSTDGAPPGLLGARQVLNTVIGVRAEPSYYDDSDDDGQWDGLIDYDTSAYDPADPGAAWGGRDWSGANGFDNVLTSEIFLHPNTGSCFLDKSMLMYPQVPANYMTRPSGNVDWTLLAEAIDTPNWFWDTNSTDPDYIFNNFWGIRPEFRSAEYRAGCGSGNIGGALNGAQRALVEGGRIEGAVWLMVLMSDGASGVSDPIARNIDPVTGDAQMLLPNPFNQDGVAPAYDPLPGRYGAFGVCPYGEETNRGEVLLDADFFPYCSDKQPETRHYCSAMPMPPSQHELDHPDCNEAWYDADDYARDWADWVALSNLQVDARYPIARASSEQLPTIFTIGIGLDFSPFDADGIRACGDNDWACRISQVWSYEDYLGEQLLRYIADAGDNGQIDDDYWQCVMGARLPNAVMDCGDKTEGQPWSSRGPCEVQSSEPSDRGRWMPLQPRQSCGNYFAAAEASDLEQVFNIIASRMFTRLSQ